MYVLTMKDIVVYYFNVVDFFPCFLYVPKKQMGGKQLEEIITINTLKNKYFKNIF